MKRASFIANALRRAAGSGEPGSSATFGERLRALWPVLLAAVFFAAIAAIGAHHVTLRLRELELGRELSEAHETRSGLEQQRKALQTELETFSASDRVLPTAREKLRLLPPHPSQLGAPPP